MRRSTVGLVSAIALVLASSALLLAQGGATGAITGTVQDSSGGVLPSAEVRIVESQTGVLVRTLRTNADGVFTAPLLPVGVYKVDVSASGFADGEFPGIDVRVTETTRLIATLEPKALKQTVNVRAEVESVQTTTPATGESVGAQTIRNLPLATQNFQQLLTLSSGASSGLNASASLGRGDVHIEVNGGREDNNNYLIEGVSASDYNQGVLASTPLPSPDVVEEFKVSTSLYDATQGRNGGGNINAILKSGSKDFHFDVFEFFRNTSLNANDFFLNSQDLQRPEVKQNIFGGSAGGPLGRGGQFGYFFGNYQGTRQRSGESPGTFLSTIIPVIPSDRSAASLSQAFFGNSTTALDPVSLALLNFKSNQFGGAGGGWLIPSLPQTPGLGPGQARLILTTPGKFTDNQFTANWDREFRATKDRLSERFFFSNSESDLPFGGGELNQTFGAAPVPSDLGFPFQIPLRNRFLSLTETHVFTPTMLNELRFGYNRINSAQENVPIVTASDLGINRPTSNLTPDTYRFVFPSYQIGPSPTQPETAVQNVYTVLDTVSYVHGAHSLRFGGEYDRLELDKNFLQADNGEVFFTPLPNGLSDFQNFLIGNPVFGFVGGGVGTHQYRINDAALFVQDDYRATRNLTLNLGLRNEIVGAAYDLLDHIGNTDPALALQGQGPNVYPAGANQFHLPGLVANASECTLKNCYSINWGPRIGLAYDMLGHHTTSIRAGYGYYSVREDFGAVDNLSFLPPFLPIPVPGGVPGTLGTLFAQGAGTVPPAGVVSPAFVPVPSLFQGFVNGAGMPTTDTTQFPVFSGTGINFFALEVPRRWIVPNTQQWNFTLQRALGANWTFEIGYVGTKGTHLREISDPDQARLVSPQNPITLTGAGGAQYVITQNTAANANARAPYPGLAPSAFEVFADDARSIYHSLQVTVTHRFSERLYLLSSYTFSKSIDDTSTSNTSFDTVMNDQTNLRFTRGPSDFDRTHRWVTTYVYDLPFFAGSSGLRAKALGGWELSGILTLQSGTPFSIIDSGGGTALALSSPNLVTADIAPGQTLADGLTSGSLESRLSHYVNIGAFTTAPVVGPDGSTGFGNLARNPYRGPFEKNWDFSLGKNFRFTERQTLRFTAEFFNFTNTPSFASPSFTDVQNPAAFGAITSIAGTPRLIQFSLRYSF